MHDDHQVDFLQKKYEIPTERQVRARVSRATKLIGGILAIFALVGVFFSYRIAQVTNGSPGDVGNLSVFSSVATSLARLVGSDDKPLVGEEQDRINFLMLGVGGEGHDGAQLSDTIIFGSFKPSSHETGLISIPRDLVVNVPGHGLSKINAANAYGEMQGKGKGLSLASQVVGDVMGEEIHYVMKIDFNGFEKLINQLGGVDVCVERDFSDSMYPEYEGSPTVMTIAFEAGCQRMDGETALQYARSRHGNNNEGGDYARAARQQKLIMAVKDRANDLDILLNPVALTRVLDTLSSHIATNLTFWEIVRFAKYLPDIDTNNIAMEVTDTEGGYVYNAWRNGLGSVAEPVNDDWSDFHALADNLFNLAPEDTGTASATPAATPTVMIEVQNGTAVSGLAYQTAQRLEGSAFQVVHIANATQKGLARTVIYDLTDGRKSAELAELQRFLGADVVSSVEGWVYADDVVPTDLTATDDPAATLVTSEVQVDFLVIVGEDAASFAIR